MRRKKKATLRSNTCWGDKINPEFFKIVNCVTLRHPDWHQGRRQREREKKKKKKQELNNEARTGVLGWSPGWQQLLLCPRQGFSLHWPLSRAACCVAASVHTILFPPPPSKKNFHLTYLFYHSSLFASVYPFKLTSESRREGPCGSSSWPHVSPYVSSGRQPSEEPFQDGVSLEEVSCWGQPLSF